MSVISMKEFLEAGVHFGHQTRKWNPKMKPFIFMARNDIHIINLEITTEQVDKAYSFIRDVAASGKSILFVGTKKQAQEVLKEEAERCGMFYVTSRWLGGCLTNFKTIRARIDRLNKLNQMEKVGEFDLLPKKEVAILKAERDKLEKNLGGIKDMRELPGAIFVVDPTCEHICVKEAISLKIPMVALVDTNCDPTGISYVIAGNDDAIRSVKLIAHAMADAVIEAKEGVAPAKSEEAADEQPVNMEEAIKEMAPVIKPEDKDKKPAKKPRAKKEAKEDEQEAIKEEAKAEEVKEEKKAKAEKSEKPASKAKTATKEKTEDKKQPAEKTTKPRAKKAVKEEE